MRAIYPNFMTYDSYVAPKCYMQDSIHSYEYCETGHLHYAIYGFEGVYQGLTCSAHLSHTKRLNYGDEDGPFTYAPFYIFNPKEYTR